MQKIALPYSMYKFPITRFRRFDEVPKDALNSLRFLVCLYDFEWRCRFLNNFACEYFGPMGNRLLGKVLWEEFEELLNVPAYKQLKLNAEKGVVARIETLSPVTAKRLSITSYTLDDCYYLAASVLADKEQLIDELRHELSRRATRPVDERS